jgi:aryl-alcohol dehydrogenase-like predicted oxidoreductase
MTAYPRDLSGLWVSRLGLGLAALGRPGYINLGHASDLEQNYDPAAMERHCHEVLDAAWAAGVRYFDAARSYGNAEAFLASWLASRRIDPAEVTIGSKWGYTYTAGWQVHADKHEVKVHSLTVLRRQFAESQTLLGRYLRLYQIHSATLESGVLENQEVLAELKRMRGPHLRIGLTLSGPKQAETLNRAMDLQLFDCVQATWNLLEPSVGPALRQAHDQGIGVIVKEALANGRLTARNSDPSFAEKRQILEKCCNELDCSLDALAIAAALDQPWADVVLSGAATAEQARSNATAIEVRLTDAVRQRLAGLAESPASYWAARGTLAWN